MKRQLVVFGITLAAALAAEAFEVQQVFREERFTRGNVNLRPLQAIDKASWIWTDGAVYDHEKSFPVVRFRKTFASDGSKLVFDVSADARYVLLLDGRTISRGPHKGFLEHWYYQSYEVEGLAAGEHTLDAVVFFLGKNGPLSILSSGRGGFILKAEGRYDDLLTTGKAPWQAANVPCMTYGRVTDPDTMTGCENIVCGTGFLDWSDLKWQPTFAVKRPVVDQEYGFHRKSWALFPTEREDEIERPCAPGAVKAAQMLFDETNAVYSAADVTCDWTAKFERLLKNGEKAEIPANTSARFLWDLENYYCGFPELETSGGAGARIRWGWAEALYAPFTPTGQQGELYLHKGNRGEFLGKRMFRSMYDTFLPDGRANAAFTTPWWKCGRWIEIAVKTGDAPLTLSKLGLIESRYPIAVRSSFECDDASIRDICRIAVRGMECCAHEMFMDCPYFEQQMYPGDTRVEMLILNTLSGDDRLLRYGIGIFDYSRRHNGMIRMNFPSIDGQDSSTYSMCWAMMLGDYALWHGANEFLRQRIPGLRQTLSQIDTYRNKDGLLENLPGWSFEDWSEPWGWFGVAPDGRFGCSAVDNLLYVYALLQAARAERACGDLLMGDYWTKKAGDVAQAVLAKFWSEERGLIADTLKKDRFSEHAQCLALLADILPADRAARVFKGLVESKDLAPTTVYFSHYLFETYFKFGRADLFLKRLNLWRDYVKDDLKTPMEAPGTRGRSDCHAWGAHPLYHMQTGLAGVKPAADGYAKVLVAPQPGSLKFIRAKCPTPRGIVSVDLRFDDGEISGTVTLPENLPGAFLWKGKERALVAGTNVVGGLAPEGGLSFDFAAVSAEKFKDDPVAANLIADKDRHAEGVHLVGSAQSETNSELKIPVALADNEKGTRIRLSFHYRAHPVSGKAGRSIVFINGQEFNDKGYVYSVLPETDEYWHYFSKEYKAPAGLKSVEVNPRVEKFGELDLKDLKLCEVKANLEDPDIEIMNSPMGYMGGDFAVSQNGMDIVNFQWRQVKGSFDLKAKNEFVATVPAGFELVAPLNPVKGTMQKRALPDGVTEVRFATLQKPLDGRFDWWRRLGFMVTSKAAVGTRGKATFRFEQNGKPLSNVAEIGLFVIPEIGKVTVAKRFDLGVALASRVGLFSEDEAVDRAYAEFMARSGIRWIKGFGSTADAPPKFWREAGITKITPEGPIANAYSVIADPQPPAGERFEALHPKRGHWLSHSICPAAVYQEKPFFMTNILARLKRSHAGADGSYANWEPFFCREEGCMCDSCRAEFAKWSKLEEADVAKDWPACIARTGRFGKDIRAFRSWQCAQVVNTLDRHVRAVTGGEHSLGLIPAVHFEQATRRWIGHTDMAEYDMLEYGKGLKWICPWGPYSGFWDAAAPFGGISVKWMGDYFNAKDTILDFRRDYPGIKALAYPHGLQGTSWVIEPEMLGLNLNAYFFFGWDAAMVYFFPMGYDARYWAQIAAAARNAAKYEGFLFDGRRIDDLVTLVPDASYPPPDAKAFDHHFPSFQNVSYLQSVAYELYGKRIVAVFNYHPTDDAVFTLAFRDGEKHALRVPAARVKVFEFKP